VLVENAVAVEPASKFETVPMAKSGAEPVFVSSSTSKTVVSTSLVLTMTTTDASEKDPSAEDAGGRSGCEYEYAECTKCANDNGCMPIPQAVHS